MSKVIGSSARFRHEEYLIENAYLDYTKFIGQLAQKIFAEKILNTSRQNLSGRIRKKGRLNSEDVQKILAYLEKNSLMENEYYIKLKNFYLSKNAPVSSVSIPITCSAPANIIYAATGDSMSPQINSGDSLIVNTTKKEIVDGSVYCVNYNGREMVRRLQVMSDGSIKLITQNPNYDSFAVDKSKKFDIIGEVIGLYRAIR